MSILLEIIITLAVPVLLVTISHWLTAEDRKNDKDEHGNYIYP